MKSSVINVLVGLFAVVMFGFPSGGILGIGSGLGLQFDFNGKAYFYSVTYDSNGYIAAGSVPKLVANSTWSYVNIYDAELMTSNTTSNPINMGGIQAIRVNASSIPQQDDLIYVVYSGEVKKGLAHL